MIKTVSVPSKITATEGQDIPAQIPIENTELLDTGIKFDSAKTRYDLVSPEWEEGLAKVMTHGATKYAARNWENGILISRCYAGLRRHVAAFMRGEDIDPDSGLPHLFHANANLQFLWAMPRIHPEMDDRQTVAICSVQKLNVATPTEQEGEPA